MTAQETVELDLSELLERERVGHRPVDPAVRQQFFSQGYVQLDGLWGEEFAAAFAAEARGRWGEAELPEGRPRPLLVPSRAPSRQTTVATAPVLSSLHFALVGMARALTGRMLVPAFAVYNYYEADDGVWLHVDAEECEATLLSSALGEVGPLHLHPELQGMTLEQLGALEKDPDWSPGSDVRVGYPRLGVTALRGGLIPHSRPGQPVSGLSAVAALHYRSLF